MNEEAALAGSAEPFEWEFGPFSWINWRARDSELPRRSVWEFQFYSDAEIVGQQRGLGPYDLLNTVPASARWRGGAEPVVVLRAADCTPLPEQPASLSWLVDAGVDEELASMLSLVIGVRCRSGGAVRWFRPDEDPLGDPIQWDHRPPHLPSARGGAFLVPGLSKRKELGESASLLTVYSRLSGAQADSLVRAARQYQEGAWIVESDPEAAWLRWVSALEVAAAGWAGEQQDPISRLNDAMPDLVDALRQGGGPDLIGQIAPQLAPTLKSTARFLQFTMKFLPGPPPARPPKSHQIDWSRMRRLLGQIYDYRSKALHEGHRWPEPMRGVQILNEDWEAPSEVMPHEMARGWESWRPRDTPMMLHVFEHVVRGTALNWWRPSRKTEWLRRTPSRRPPDRTKGS